MKLMVTRGNALQIPQTMLNWDKMYGNACGDTLK